MRIQISSFLMLVCVIAMANAKTTTYQNWGALVDGYETAVAGDTLIVKNGAYTIQDAVTFSSTIPGGARDNPIIIKAETDGGVTLTGGSSVAVFKQGSHDVVVQGFRVTVTDETAFKMDGSQRIRITRNYLKLGETGSLTWVIIGGSGSEYNRIDHCTFDGKLQAGNYIQLGGTWEAPWTITKNDRIDHNYFNALQPRAVNEKEAIRIGYSEISLLPSYCIVEYNYFSNCDGDPEIISVKSCDNTVRYNTFFASMGTLSLRHGNRTAVYGNVFLGNGKDSTGGFRIYGDNHLIFNNYLEGLTGSLWDAAITITNGDADYPTTDLTKHLRPKNCYFIHNTFVNNAHTIEIGYDHPGNDAWSKPPMGIHLINNVFVCNQFELFKFYTTPVDFDLKNNMINLTGTASLGYTLSASQAIMKDPLLASSGTVKGLTAASPAINAGADLGKMKNMVTIDIEKDNRTGVYDIGADEYTSGSVSPKAPLSATDVGPASPEGGTLEDCFVIDTGTMQTLVRPFLGQKSVERARVVFHKNAIALHMVLDVSQKVSIVVRDLKGSVISSTIRNCAAGKSQIIITNGRAFSASMLVVEIIGYGWRQKFAAPVMSDNY